MSADEVMTYFKGREVEMLDALKKLVDIESPSEDIAALDEFATALQLYVEAETHAAVTIVRSGTEDRPQLKADLGRRTDVLFVGHFDTVHPLGTVLRMPFHVEGDKAYGAGILDMKAGLVMMTEVARWLTQELPEVNLTLFFNSDEEIGSPESADIERKLASEAQLVVIFEYTNDETVVKISSRGASPHKITIHGRGGHAAYPEGLSNPISAIAELIVKASELHKPELGQVVVPTIVSGGLRNNVVPEEASVIFDVRISDDGMIPAIEKGFRDITFTDPAFSVSVEVLHSIASHRAEPDSYALGLAQKCGAELSMHIDGVEARGASDLNHIAPVNPNVVEALGASGNGAHSAEREYILISSLARRASLAALMTRQALLDAALGSS